VCLPIPSDRRKGRPMRKSHSFIDSRRGRKQEVAAADVVDDGGTLPADSHRDRPGPLHRSFTFACDTAPRRGVDDAGGPITPCSGRSSPSSRVCRKVETWMNSCGPVSSPLELQVPSCVYITLHTSLRRSWAVFAGGD